MSKWQNTTIGQVAKNVSRSFDFSNKEKVVFINTGDVLDGEFLHHDHVLKNGLPGQAKKAIKKGDILFSEIRPANKRFAFVKSDSNDYVVSTKFMVIQSNGAIDQDYLYQFLTSKSSLSEFQRIAESRSGTFPQITFDSISDVPVSFPDMPEQKKISQALSFFSKKIEINNKINQTLESMAMLIFNEWFINNKLPNINVNLVDIKNSQIPQGWQIAKIGDEMNVVLGGTPSRNRKEYWGGDVPWINSGKANEFRIIEASEYITNEGLLRSSAKLLPKRSTIIAITGATLGQVSLLEIEASANQSVIGLHSANRLSSEFVYLYIKKKINEIILSAAGGAHQHINKQVIEDTVIIIPERNILERFNKIVAPMFDQIANNEFENKKISFFRELMLPKLMNGEIKL